LGIAERQITIECPLLFNNQKACKPLQESIESIGDWIKSNRLAKNLTPGQLGMKMGIASGLVCSWENRTGNPNQFQIAAMERIFGTAALPRLCFLLAGQ
jgi:ribosome-binding protein aMBF1 (putative translation factor)